MHRKIFLLYIIFFSSFVIFNHASAQPAWTVDLLSKEKKPGQFENRQLGSEKMAAKKFTPVRHFFQNSYTHYNYYYNANNKLNNVIARAKLAQSDDFNKLLSFYPYSLDNTVSQKKELDSVILKATAGILLHDLRNDWIDNMYLLLGEAYFFKKEFDSAAATFQFINYNLFPRKRKDDDEDKVVGTNYASTKGNLSIANKESLNPAQKIFSKPPSRNDALLWLCRTQIEQGEYYASAGLIKTLQNDPNFPPRLQYNLNELNAYLFYKLEAYDSVAFYLEKSLYNNNKTRQERSRDEFLLAQIYESEKQYNRASYHYQLSSKFTSNPIQDIYANLNDAKMRKDNDEKDLNNSIESLKRMAKKDKYEAYRDIIYFAEAELILQKKDTVNALEVYKKCSRTSTTNIEYKNKAFLKMADIAFKRKQFKTAYANYDSLQTGDTSLSSQIVEIKKKINILSEIVEKINIIEREDSLQKIAALSLPERDAFLKKLSKDLRKAQGLKEEENSGMVITNPIDSKDKSTNLFGDAPTQGEWYFYNNSVKTKGLSDFKTQWGTRSNSDNWRRKSALDAQQSTDMMGVANPDVILPDSLSSKNKSSTIVNKKQDISYDGLLADLPVTPAKLAKSNHLIAISIFRLAQLFQNRLEDFPLAIDMYNESLTRFPDSLYNGELYLGLYYCNYKLGNADKAAYYKNLITTNFKNSTAEKILNNPNAAKPMAKNAEVTKRYEDIYNMFIEGSFQEAIDQKHRADSLYGKNYWSPQLLYIESVYYIKQRDDSTATKKLTEITKLFPTSPLASKATNLINVLGRRKEIEKHLRELVVNRDEDNTALVNADTSAKKKPVVIYRPAPLDSVKKIIAKTDSSLATNKKPNVVNRPPTIDSTKKIIAKADSSIASNKKPLVINQPPTIDSSKKLITKLDSSVAVNKKPVIIKQPAKIDSSNKLIAKIDSLTDSNKKPTVISWSKTVDSTQKMIAKIDSSASINKKAVEIIPSVKIDSSNKLIAKIDSSKIQPTKNIVVPTPMISVGEYTSNPASPHSVVMILNKVDPTYINEVKNALNRYNEENFSSLSLQISKETFVTDSVFLIISTFENDSTSLHYFSKIKKDATLEISWLPAAKYSFIICNADNLDKLKKGKNFPEYKVFLNKLYPGKF